METRKAQKVGGGTFTISIPKEWATKYGVEAGTELHLFTHGDGSIVVRSATRDREDLSSARVELTGSGPALVRRALRAAYLAGFEIVTLTPASSFSTAERRAIRTEIRQHVGTEIARERDDEITVKTMLDASDVSVHQSVVQLQFVALSAHRRATEALAEADSDTADQLRERRNEANRLSEMIARHLSRSLSSFEEIDSLGVTRTALYDYNEVARELAKVADLSLAIARASEDVSGALPTDLATEVTEKADAAREVVDAAASAFLDDAGAEQAQSALDRQQAVLEAIEGLDATGTELNPDEIRALTRVVDALHRTADCGGTVATIALRAATRSETP